MIIKIKDFKLIQHPISGFDLYREVKARKIGEGTMQNPLGEEYLKDEFIGYNMTLEKCIKDIIHLIQCDSDEVVSLEEYVKSYKSIKEEITNLLE